MPSSRDYLAVTIFNLLAKQLDLQFILALLLDLRQVVGNLMLCREGSATSTAYAYQHV